MNRIAVERPELVDEVHALVTRRGPVAAASALPDGHPRGDGSDFGTGTMWNWRNAKIVLEWLFYLGTVTTATRRGFERLYDLTERVLPAEVLAAPTPAPEDAQRDLIRIARPRLRRSHRAGAAPLLPPAGRGVEGTGHLRRCRPARCCRRSTR